MFKRNVLGVAALVVLVFLIYSGNKTFSEMKGGGKMQITSSVFTEGGMIPAEYTCDGKDISPPLEWKDFPAGTKSFALISDDPDAPVGLWVHWIIYNIPVSMTKLEEHVRPEREFKNGMRQGSNSWPKIGYGGPCPPSGTHRYYFKLYALDAPMTLAPGAAKAELLQALKGHILAEAQLMGKYKRLSR